MQMYNNIYTQMELYYIKDCIKYPNDVKLFDKFC